MKKLLYCLTLILIGNSVLASRVVGYLPAHRYATVGNSINYEQLTHLCISFANPDSTGMLSLPDGYETIVSNARAANCKILLAIGGGGLKDTDTEEYYKNLTKASQRPAFIHSIMQFALARNFDGIDADLEGNMILMPTYNDFIQQLSDSCKANNLTISAALARWNGSFVNRATIESLDFINIMAYGNTGPWNINNPGHHSSYTFAVESYQMWKNNGAVDDQLVLGVPFYGFEFQDSVVNGLTWCRIIQTYPEAITNDTIITPNGVLYHNGIPNIEEKVEYVFNQNGGGIMIWEVGQDCFDENSLLSVITNKNHELQGSTVGQQEKQGIKSTLYPNPTNGIINLNTPNFESAEIYSTQGNKVGAYTTTTININNLSAGTYYLIVHSNMGTKTHVIAKK